MDSPESWRWVWLALATGFAVGEIAVAGSFFLLPFAVGAGAAALATFAGASVLVGWLVFVAVSAAAFAVLVPFGRRLDRRGNAGAVGAARWAGREAVVVRPIPAGDHALGAVRLDGEEWRAQSVTGTAIRAGSTVLVSKLEGNRLLVLPLSDPLEALPGPEGG